MEPPKSGVRGYFVGRIRSRIAGFVALAAVFFSIFQFNAFRTVEHGWFVPVQRESEALVISGLIHDRQGQESVLGLGSYAYGSAGWLDNIYQSFRDDRDPAAKYLPYVPQLGLQGIGFRVVQSLTGSKDVATYQSINSIILSLLLAAIVLWSVKEFGWLSGVLMASVVIFNPWLVGLARNLYWAPWTWFFPMFAVGAALAWGESRARDESALVAALLFFTVALKSLCGYEFVTTVAIAAMVPIVYFQVKTGAALGRMIRDYLIYGLAIASGVGAAFAIHAYARAGDVYAGLQGILWDAARRTHGGSGNLPPESLESLNASIFAVLSRYFLESYQPILTLPYVHFVFLIGLMSVAGIRIFSRETSKGRALALAFAVAIAAPLSWIVGAKGHSYVHLHINFVLWSVPTLLIGAACIGYAFVVRSPAGTRTGADVLERTGLAEKDFRPVLRRSALIVFAVLAIALRLALSADRDVLALNRPEEDYWYVIAALRGAWGGSYDYLAFANLPVYSLWLALNEQLGFPGRLSIDVAWLLASGYLAFAIAKLTREAWGGVLCFAVLAFHPFSFLVFDRAMPESLLGVAVALALAGAVEIWNCHQVGACRRMTFGSFAFAMGFGVAVNMTPGAIIFLLPLIGLATISIWRREAWWRGPALVGIGFRLIVFPALAALVVALAVSGLNAARWGIGVRHELAAPGFLNLIDALYAIAPTNSTSLGVPVASDRLPLAFSVSPTLSELRPHLERSLGAAVRKESASHPAVAGELDARQLRGAVRRAADSAGWHKSAPGADSKYERAAIEIRSALSQGILASRTTWPFLVDPVPARAIRELNHHTLANFDLLLRPKRFEISFPREDASELQSAHYARVFGKRHLAGNVAIAGWIQVPEGTRIELADAAQTFSGLKLSGPARSDVPRGLTFQISSLAGEAPNQLIIRTPDGGNYRLPLASLAVGQVVAVPGLADAHVGIDHYLTTGRELRLGTSRLRALTEMWSDVHLLLLAGAFAGVLFAVVRPKVVPRAVAGVGVISMVVTVLLAGLMASFSPGSWYGFRPGLVFPFLPILTAFGVLGTCMAFRACCVDDGGNARPH